MKGVHHSMYRVLLDGNVKVASEFFEDKSRLLDVWAISRDIKFNQKIIEL